MCGNFAALKKRRQQKKELEQQLEQEVKTAQTELDLAQESIRPSMRSWILDASSNLRDASWGLVPAWAKDPTIARHTFNARAETIAEKPAFRDAFRSGRCLVPALGWWEWDKTRRKTFIRRPDKRQLLFAGLEVGDTFTIVTQAAAPDLAEIHERQPVLLDPDQARRWLDGRASVGELAELLSVQRTWPLLALTEQPEGPEQLGLGL